MRPDGLQEPPLNVRIWACRAMAVSQISTLLHQFLPSGEILLFLGTNPLSEGEIPNDESDGKEKCGDILLCSPPNPSPWEVKFSIYGGNSPLPGRIFACDGRIFA